jgi:hypothetical protein
LKGVLRHVVRESRRLKPEKSMASGVVVLSSWNYPTDSLPSEAIVFENYSKR